MHVCIILVVLLILYLWDCSSFSYVFLSVVGHILQYTAAVMAVIYNYRYWQFRGVVACHQLCKGCVLVEFDRVESMYTSCAAADSRRPFQPVWYRNKNDRCRLRVLLLLFRIQCTDSSTWRRQKSFFHPPSSPAGNEWASQLFWLELEVTKSKDLGRKLMAVPSGHPSIALALLLLLATI